MAPDRRAGQSLRIRRGRTARLDQLRLDMPRQAVDPRIQMAVVRENAKTGAYGIPQSLPASKMAEFGANYRDDGAVQIDWGLAYIARRYGSPSKAWERSEQIGWY